MRGHGKRILCRHCDMVQFYYLERDSQIRFKESLACRDESFRPVTFREWLEAFQWEREPPEQIAA